MCFVLNIDDFQYCSELGHPLAGWRSLSVFSRLYRTAGRTDKPIGRAAQVHFVEEPNEKRQYKRRRRQCVLQTLAETEISQVAVEQTPANHRCRAIGTPSSTAQQIVPRAEECWPLAILLEKYPELRFERWLPKSLRNAKRAGGGEPDERFLRGPHGHLLCLWCSKETGSRKKLFCAAPKGSSRRLTVGFGEGCEHEHRMRRDNQYVRDQLKMRDRGVCRYCSTETHELFLRAVACKTLSERNALFKELSRHNPEWLKKVKRPLTSMDYDFNEGMFWEAAHVIDVKHGGGLCGLDGYNTLCVPCHNEEYMRSYMTNLSTLPLYRSPQADGPPKKPMQEPLFSVATPNLTHSRHAAATKTAASTGRLRKAAPPRSAPRTVQTSLRSAAAFVSPIAASKHPGLSKKPAPAPNLLKELSLSSSGSLPSPTSCYLLGPSSACRTETPTKNRLSGGLVDLTSSTDTSMLSKSSKRKSLAKISPIKISSDEYSDEAGPSSDSDSDSYSPGRRAFSPRSPASTMSEYSSYSRGGEGAQAAHVSVTTRTTARVSRDLFSAVADLGDSDAERFAKVTVRRGKKPIK
ncbi:hypothetical protein LPJ56_005163 [Coemansia sp. RSA 2599]|nr:hypothetical protein LPJ56_005163 [Coemansia sp. RSA 2599]